MVALPSTRRLRIDALQRHLVEGRAVPEELPAGGDLGPEDLEGRSFPSFVPGTRNAMRQVSLFLGEVAEAWDAIASACGTPSAG